LVFKIQLKMSGMFFWDTVYIHQLKPGAFLFDLRLLNAAHNVSVHQLN